MVANFGGVGQVCRQLSIGSLPNEVLLEIFASLGCHAAHIFTGKYAWLPQWHTLVHVCRRWRYVVFSSPSGSVGSANYLYTQNPCEGDVGYLAKPSYRRT